MGLAEDRGLSLRPSYAAATSVPFSSTWSVAYSSGNFQPVLDPNPDFATPQTFSAFIGFAGTVTGGIQGDCLSNCSMNIDAFGDLTLGPKQVFQANSNVSSWSYALGLVGDPDFPITISGQFTCN